jgi:cytochrome c5
MTLRSTISSRLLCLLFLAPSAFHAQSTPKAAAAPATAPAPTKTAGPAKRTPATHSDPAERAFQANCNRCHYAPETLSPRITGTVVRHMRLRANLSAEDERLILSYLNP